jgi:glutamate-5-semialdehyde dehydrogenase
MKEFLMELLAKKCKTASKTLMKLDHKTRNTILREMSENLVKNVSDIVKANELDLAQAETSGLSAAMKDRLKLDETRIKAMASGVLAVAEQAEVVGTFHDEFTDPTGLKIKKQRIPLGVILMIFESRPNVVVDCAALAIKSSNAIILKGGKEAKHSNEILGTIIQSTIEKYVPKECVQVLASDNREVITELLELKQYIDVVIPRGGEKLVQFVHEKAKMPVIAHFQGLCHMYLDKSANISKAVKLVLNAKTQRTGVCNAIETLLIHKDLLPQIAKTLTIELKNRGTELRVDKEFMMASGEDLKAATDADWATEYLDNILSIKTVNTIDEALTHIDQYGSFHTECIVSEDEKACDLFLTSVDASCVMVNASSRFNDGGQLGLGAELGISTTKFHAYGPMGAEQMTTTRFVVTGDGHTRA